MWPWLTQTILGDKCRMKMKWITWTCTVSTPIAAIVRIGYWRLLCIVFTLVAPCRCTVRYPFAQYFDCWNSFGPHTLTPLHLLSATVLRSIVVRYDVKHSIYMATKLPCYDSLPVRPNVKQCTLHHRNRPVIHHSLWDTAVSIAPLRHCICCTKRRSWSDKTIHIVPLQNRHHPYSTPSLSKSTLNIVPPQQRTCHAMFIDRCRKSETSYLCANKTCCAKRQSSLKKTLSISLNGNLIFPFRVIFQRRRH